MAECLRCEKECVELHPEYEICPSCMEEILAAARFASEAKVKAGRKQPGGYFWQVFFVIVVLYAGALALEGVLK